MPIVDAAVVEARTNLPFLVFATTGILSATSSHLLRHSRHLLELRSHLCAKHIVAQHQWLWHVRDRQGQWLALHYWVARQEDLSIQDPSMRGDGRARGMHVKASMITETLDADAILMAQSVNAGSLFDETMSRVSLQRSHPQLVDLVELKLALA